MHDLEERSTYRFPADATDEWVLPAGYEPPSHDQHGWAPIPCRSCGQLVLFARTRRGASAPLNQDGTSHFSNCPNAAQWRRK